MHSKERPFFPLHCDSQAGAFFMMHSMHSRRSCFSTRWCVTRALAAESSIAAKATTISNFMIVAKKNCCIKYSQEILSRKATVKCLPNSISFIGTVYITLAAAKLSKLCYCESGSFFTVMCVNKELNCVSQAHTWYFVIYFFNE